jgi:transcription elongation GreA/GreB family factor
VKPTSKKALRAELVKKLEATLAVLEEAHAAATEGATHEEAKPENDKDTRALEQSYLARGQAQRVASLRAGLAAVGVMSVAATDVARVGALVEVEDDDGEVARYLLAPDGGGTKLSGGVQVVTPVSPLGSALVDKRAGDEVDVSLGGRRRQLTVLSVS